MDDARQDPEQQHEPPRAGNVSTADSPSVSAAGSSQPASVKR